MKSLHAVTLIFGVVLSFNLGASAQKTESEHVRLVVNELIVRDPKTGNSVSIVASPEVAGIWIENKSLKRGVAMVSTGSKVENSQTFVSLYETSRVWDGQGFNFAFSLGVKGEPIQQIVIDGKTNIREIKPK